MNPVMKFSPGDNVLPSVVLCNCPSSISMAEGGKTSVLPLLKDKG